jgi:hypothetical protein
MFKARTEVVLNLMIIGLVGINLMVGIQVLTRSSDAGQSAPRPTTTVTIPEPVGDEPRGTVPPPVGNGAATQQSLRNAAVTLQSLYLENGALPATAIELGRSVPGLKIVDGVGRVTEGTIGFLSTSTSSLLVGTTEDNEWYCIAVDVSVPSIQHGSGTEIDHVASFAACRGPADDWA